MYKKVWDFKEKLDDAWEAIAEKDFDIQYGDGFFHLENHKENEAPIYIRPCSIYGDKIDIQFAKNYPGAGIFVFGFLAGFEYINFHFDFSKQYLKIFTHEFHKHQPRFEGKITRKLLSKISVIRNTDTLKDVPYEGSEVKLLFDDYEVVKLGNIDFLPECLFMFGLKGKGTLTLSSFSIEGKQRPRPEYLRVGIWQQSTKPTTKENVDALIRGTKIAAESEVQILVTPETSLTGLRISKELMDRNHIQKELLRFQKAISKINNAPYVLIGYPEWIDGKKIEGATEKLVRINCHRFVRPDGTLGPMMAKVHSCEEGFWHGRNYNFQRVCGTEVAVGICHDGHYQDVWAVCVMGGARLCLHPSAGGRLTGKIPEIVNSYRMLGTDLDAFWVRVNAGGGSCIVYPCKNRKQKETILAVPDDLTEKNPSYPDYSYMGDLFACAKIRLWDATGCYPLRTLRNGRKYNIWKQLIPEIQEV